MHQGMTGLDWVFVLVFMVIFIDAMRGFNGSARIFRWLKGSRMSFYLSDINHRFDFTEIKMRGAILIPVIELSRGPFRRRSALYGRNSSNWKMAVGHWDVNFVQLQDRKGVPVKTALELVVQYPSLQAMLDRIAEQNKSLVDTNNRIADLERELKTSQYAERLWLSALGALLTKINLDRQRFRSQAAQEIREDLEVILGDVPTMSDAHSAVAEWLNTFEARRFEARHGCR